ncbi:centromere protein W isoform X1 [Paroedura picta]|uniref:centromere protein W isoform X1 n=1 Tax=Paroedura picta TaxID=143630 RepID=UPI0040579793
MIVIVLCTHDGDSSLYSWLLDTSDVETFPFGMDCLLLLIRERKKVHLNFLLFLHRLAEETRTKAIADKSKTIKYEHVLTSAKKILKKSRG